MTAPTPRCARRWPWLAVVSLVLAGGPAPPPELVQRQGPALATVQGGEATHEGLRIWLSDELAVTLQVEGKGPLEVETPAKLILSPGWDVHQGDAPQTTVDKDGRTRWRQAFGLEPAQTGKLTLQLAPLRFREAGGPWRQAAWKPWAVAVITRVPRADVSEARDITSIEELPAEPGWPLWPLLVLPAAGAILAVVIWLLVGRPLPRVRGLSAERAALRALDRAAGLPLTGAAEVERYHTLVSDIVRRYLERRFHLAAPRQTTAEFLEAMRRSPGLPAEQQELLRDLLSRCDLAKFAPVTPSADECQAVAGLARRFVEQTAPPGNGPARCSISCRSPRRPRDGPSAGPARPPKRMGW